VEDSLLKLLSYRLPEVPHAKPGKTVLESIELPEHLPGWLKEEDLQYYADSFLKTGFTGGFNFYRNIQRYDFYLILALVGSCSVYILLGGKPALHWV
jgi:hypothetical protein